MTLEDRGFSMVVRWLLVVRWLPVVRWLRGFVVVMVLVVGLVPVGSAHAQPPGAPAGLDRFYRQRPVWAPCHDAALDAAGAHCAGVLVPLDYSQPGGRTLTIAVSRIAAAVPAHRRGFLLTNPGGPGGPGLTMPVVLRDRVSPAVRADYDLVGMDPRGIGRSDPVQCAVSLPTLMFSAGFDLFGYARDATLAAVLAGDCLASDQQKTRAITTRNTARDMDIVRSVFGDRALNYYGASYGTYLGAVYTQLFPQHSGRIVLDSAVDPDRYWTGMYQDMGPINEYALDDWAAWAARHDAEYRFGRGAAQVRAYVEDLIHRAAGHPIAAAGYLIDEHTVPLMLLALLSNPQENAALGEVVGIVSAAVSGLPFDMNELKAKVTAAVPLQPAGEAAVLCGDKAAPRDPRRYYADIERARATQPVFGAFANNITVCAFWPPPVELPTLVRNDIPVLILQADHDTRTAYPEGVALHRDLSASRLITLAGARIHGTFRQGLSPCLEDAVDTYLSTGVLPSTDLTCHPEPGFFPH
jgi:pimeloyl-ACP methyl ester carboxylesterase